MRIKRMPANGRLTRVPEVIAKRECEDVCCDEDCALSGGEAHAGDCEPCDCGLLHAREECEIAHAAGYRP